MNKFLRWFDGTIFEAITAVVVGSTAVALLWLATMSDTLSADNVSFHTDNIMIALIVAVPATLSPILLAILTNYNRHKERAEDRADREKVALQAAEAARLLAQSQIEVAKTARETNDKLDVIHVAVNSNMTASMEGELKALRDLLNLLQATRNGRPYIDQVSIEVTKDKILELTAKLEDRLKPQS